MPYTQTPRYLILPSGGGPEVIPTREEQVIGYGAAIAISTTQNITTVLIGTLTGALSLTIGVTAGVNNVGCYDGDEVIIKLPADATGRTVTFSTGFTAQAATFVLGSNKVGVITFIYDGATSTWVEQSRNILAVSTVGGNNTFTGNNIFSGNNAFSGNDSFAGQSVKNQTPYTPGTDTTAGWTLTAVKTGLVAGILKTTSASGVTMTLDSVANIIIAFAAAGMTIGVGSTVEFIVDNSQGANTVTLSVDSGNTITAAHQVSAGDTSTAVQLTVAATSIGYAVGRFSLYLTSATTANLFRIG